VLYGIIGALCVIIIVLIIKLSRKVKSDRFNIEQERKELEELNTHLYSTKL